MFAATPSADLRRALGAGMEGDWMRAEGLCLTVAFDARTPPHATIRLIDDVSEVEQSLQADLARCAHDAVLSYLATRLCGDTVQARMVAVLGARRDAVVLPYRVEIGGSITVCGGNALAWTGALAAVNWTDRLAQLARFAWSARCGC